MRDPRLTPHQRKVLDAFLAAPGRKLSTDQLLIGLKMAKYSSRMSELKTLGYNFDKHHDPHQGWVHRLVGTPVQQSQPATPVEPAESVEPAGAAAPVASITPTEPTGTFAPAGGRPAGGRPDEDDPRLQKMEQTGRLFDLPAREHSDRDGTPAIYREAA